MPLIETKKNTAYDPSPTRIDREGAGATAYDKHKKPTRYDATIA